MLLCPNILSADCFDEYAIGVRYGSGVGMVGYRSSGGYSILILCLNCVCRFAQACKYL